MGQTQRSKQLALQKRIAEAERQAAVLRLFEEGLTPEEIAKRLTLTRGQVENDIQARIEKWRRVSREKIETYVAREEERIERIWREAFAAWHRSCEDAVTVTKEVVDGDEEKATGDKEKTTVRRTGQAGDASFLRVMQQCSKDIRELLGTDQPKRTEISGRGGGPIELLGHASYDDLERRRIELERIAGLDEAGGRCDGPGDHPRPAEDDEGLW